MGSKQNVYGEGNYTPSWKRHRPRDASSRTMTDGTGVNFVEHDARAHRNDR
jgi:hypothetical protein